MLVIVAACLVALLTGALLVWHRRGKDRPLALALNNMSQGVVMFDASGRVVVCNDRYLAIYGLSPDVVKPGARLIDIVRHRHANG
ncbi:MAG TPA: PAS-domain containing protein, partial [Xanthobacteraceae bacterium]|nr:PAS-domain containing protein [Xanthobacteraceae bacterium]